MLQNPDDLPKEDVLDRLLVKNLVEYAIFVVSLEGVITLWNVGAERIFGYAEGVIVGQHFGLLFTPEDAAAGAPQAELTSALAVEPPGTIVGICAKTVRVSGASTRFKRSSTREVVF